MKLQFGGFVYSNQSALERKRCLFQGKWPKVAGVAG